MPSIIYQHGDFELNATKVHDIFYATLNNSFIENKW